MDFDVFNGDADGLTALIQLRLAEPRSAQLVTGVKRDIELLDRVDASQGDRVTVLDISLDKNRGGVERLLAAGAEVDYTDHHYAGEIPQHPHLRTQINEAADVCTALLVNGRLKNRYAAWAITGAFGDNLHHSAQTLGASLGYDAGQLARLEALGTYLNYNGYGERIEDLHFEPEALYERMCGYKSPFDFLDAEAAVFEQLEAGYRDDMARAAAAKVHPGSNDQATILILPDAPWARRVCGVYSNDLVQQFPDRAHAVLTEKAQGGYLVSVRAPLNRKQGADTLCRAFPTGGGRAAAAGINHLSDDDLPPFAEAFRKQFC